MNHTRLIILRMIAAGMLLASSPLYSQTTDFTYQGSLRESADPAEGAYDFEFELYDSLNGGSSLGSPVTALGVVVTDGIFTADLDAIALTGGQLPAWGAGRWLEIRVRASGGGSYTILSPRQPLTSAPYSLFSQTASNAIMLGGTAAAQFVLTTDPRLTDARQPLSGSSSYVQNRTTQQTSTDFHISGSGTAAVLNAKNEYQLNGQRILDTDGANSLFVGPDTGVINTGANNTFLGKSAGSSNQAGFQNTFVGSQAGASNSDGDANSFLGYFAGQTVTTGNNNAFFGKSAGNGTNGSNNSFFGGGAGQWSSTGSNNTFVGSLAGNNPNGDGSNNTLIGANTSSGGSATYATAIGADAAAWKDNSVQLGRTTGEDDVRVSGSFFVSNNLQVTNGKLAIGGVLPDYELEIVSNSGNILMGDGGCPSGSTTIGFGNSLGSCENYALRGSNVSNDVWINRPLGGAIRFREGNGSTSQIVIETGGQARFEYPVKLSALGSAGATTLCRNASNEIATCSSSIRYKSEVEDFVGGIELLQKLRPVSFVWAETGIQDLGLVAEEVEEVAPVLVTYASDGSVEGVKYDRLGPVLVNVIKQQSTQINSQRVEIDRLTHQLTQQNHELRELRTIMCQALGDQSLCRDSSTPIAP